MKYSVNSSVDGDRRIPRAWIVSSQNPDRLKDLIFARAWWYECHNGMYIKNTNKGSIHSLHRESSCSKLQANAKQRIIFILGGFQITSKPPIQLPISGPSSPKSEEAWW